MVCLPSRHTALASIQLLKVSFTAAMPVCRFLELAYVQH